MKIVKQKILKFSSNYLDSDSDLPQNLRDELANVQSFDQTKHNEGIIDVLTNEYDENTLTETKTYYFSSLENWAHYESQKRQSTTYENELQIATFFQQNNVVYTEIINYNQD